jgi:hypothetical protein
MERPWVIGSESENGYWNNEQGWVYDLASATRFTELERKSFNVPTACGFDAEWVRLPKCSVVTCPRSCRNDADRVPMHTHCRG